MRILPPLLRGLRHRLRPPAVLRRQRSARGVVDPRRVIEKPDDVPTYRVLDIKRPPIGLYIVMVLAPIEQRLERLTQQRHLSEDDARARMAQQATDDQRRTIADIVIDNNGTLAELRKRASDVWHYLESCSSA